MKPIFTTDENGYYGAFGGAYIPEILKPNIDELNECYLATINSREFQFEFNKLLKDYVGRPTPLYFAKNLSKKYQARIYLKREDLCHTGSHKINNNIGQILLAKRMGKKQIIAETGAGQHGVATATVCALMNIPCTVFMGKTDMARQQRNVERMKFLGAKVVSVTSGNKTLKDATNEALRYWINHPEDTHYIIGSVVGPHPYPDMVSRFQSVISEEIRNQLIDKEGLAMPNYIIACIGGGSNAAGAFFHFMDNDYTQLIGVEAAGKGIESEQTAASIGTGSPGILHGSKTMLMQTREGQVIEPYSISAGLDYPGVGPIHAHLNQIKRAHYESVTDHEALNAAKELALLEGIIPALESSHALAVLNKLNFRKEDLIVLNLSGRGDKDMSTYTDHLMSQNK